MSPQNEQQDAAFLSYIAKRIADLSEDQRQVTLMVDEIHIKPFFDYKGGNISGVAANSGQAANRAFVFMVHSLMNKFKEVVHIVPVHKPNAEFLHKLLREVICGLEKIGFKVICVVTDNNAINKKAMLPFKPTVVPAIPTSSPKSPTNDFVFPHPCDAQRPLFFVIYTLSTYSNVCVITG
ncbi:hypothetical protein HPB48_003484 [Haemaphysalis longicornis]|uniref:Transposable element P transposase-like RNase H domain-containing protein n=1 Tax=Haemaphysalis longicornis TaxID=44386 RepID=A0A9J6GGQ0_HAELO|nr:hypothetical protein HPB48_003484 [Haemaphysalis longicornis]